MRYLFKRAKNFIINNYTYIKCYNKQKVFCIGFNKTGTTSLFYSLRDHGYSFGNFGEGERLIKDYRKGDFKKIINYCKNYPAYKDVPLSLPGVFKYLDRYFPNAKFILTVRDDAEQWYESITKFHSKTFAQGERIPTYYDLIDSKYCYKGWAWEYINSVFSCSLENPYDKDTLISSYENHINAVLKHFRNDSEKLLVINVSDENSYKLMCDFLSIKPKYSRFPWVNKTSEKKIL